MSEEATANLYVGNKTTSVLIMNLLKPFLNNRMNWVLREHRPMAGWLWMLKMWWSNIVCVSRNQESCELHASDKPLSTSRYTAGLHWRKSSNLRMIVGFFWSVWTCLHLLMYVTRMIYAQEYITCMTLSLMCHPCEYVELFGCTKFLAALLCSLIIDWFLIVKMSLSPTLLGMSILTNIPS